MEFRGVLSENQLRRTWVRTSRRPCPERQEGRDQRRRERGRERALAHRFPQIAQHLYVAQPLDRRLGYNRTIRTHRKPSAPRSIRPHQIPIGTLHALEELHVFGANHLPCLTLLEEVFPAEQHRHEHAVRADDHVRAEHLARRERDVGPLRVRMDANNLRARAELRTVLLGGLGQYAAEVCVLRRVRLPRRERRRRIAFMLA